MERLAPEVETDKEGNIISLKGKEVEQEKKKIPDDLGFVLLSALVIGCIFGFLVGWIAMNASESGSTKSIEYQVDVVASAVDASFADAIEQAGGRAGC